LLNVIDRAMRTDLVGADHLLPAVADDMPIVNREFDADNSVIKPMAAVGKTAAIPLRANRSSPRDYDRQLYGARNLIENFNPELKRFLPIATRYEKTARKALAARQLVASVVWLN
jgi:transposase